MQVEALYCLAIVHRKDLRTLRDLRAEHIPLLDNIRSRGCAAIEERFGISRDKLRIYIHYIPSYFHLHVHFIHAHHDASFGMAVGKGHALDEVISALQIDSEYFTKVVLSVALPESLAAKYKVYLESIERS
jgi:m7GpppX diphosphatase